MSPISFPEANCTMTSPNGFAESQVVPMPAFRGELFGDKLDGCPVVIVAWQPCEEDLDRLAAGSPIFLCCLGGLPPHLLTTEFKRALPPPL